MKRLILGSALLILGLTLAVPAMGQEAGENINVLPIVPQYDETGVEEPYWFLKGDGYLQRQVEPTIAASTRNPDHLLAFFNDYRAVDVDDDPFVGEQFQTAALAFEATNLMLAGLLSLPALSPFDSPPYAFGTSEAWVGMSRSYDGGLTWAGGFLPGFPFDEELDPDAQLANRESPVYGLEAATDPVLAPAPCGYFYLVFMAFTRGDQSKLAVARYQDLNNDEGGDTIQYQGTTVVEVGNNAEYGYFLDKPDIEVDVWRGATADECAHRVYVSYSTFNGLDKDGKFQSKINFAYSADKGQTFTKQKLNPPYNQNQGSALAVDPADGTVYMTWRHFFSPDAILITKSATYGVKWGKPVMLTGDPPMAPFDQPTIPISWGGDNLAFRSNGFPTAAVTGQGEVFVAWQERVDGLGIPDPDGSPRIVLMRSDDRGATWRGLGDNDERVPVDNETLDKPYNAGIGGAWQATLRGPQVQPKLSYGGGRLMLAYYESRGLISQSGGADVVAWTDLTGPSPGFITGYDRVVDFRAALLNPADGTLLGESSSIQVSRYPVRTTANLGDGQQLEDVLHAAPCDPDLDLGPTNPPCARQVNRVNLPTSAAGSSPFIGDYPDLVPMVQFVKDGTQWRWATQAADVPYRGFHAIFTDNRHIVPPWDDPSISEYLRYSNYGPPGIDGACTNSGSRNSDVLTSRVTADVVVSTPTTYKEIGSASRSFPFSVNNRSPEEGYYRLEIAAGLDFGPASFSPVNEWVTEGYIKVFPYSSVSQVLYPNHLASATDIFRVLVYKASCIDDPNTGNIDPDSCSVSCTTSEDCLIGSATFNADQSVEFDMVNLGPNDTEYQNPFVLNPFVLNQSSTNSSPSNPFVLNPFVLNPFVLNPFVLNSSPSDSSPMKQEMPASTAYEIIDTTWVVQPDEFNNNTASTQLPVINVDNAEQYVGNYAFQLIVHKTSSHGGYNEACEAYEIQQDQILSNVYQDPFVLNPFVLNPFVLNPFVLNEGAENPFVLNPFVLNSTFTMAPPDDAVASSKRFTKEAELDDGTVKAPRTPDEIKLTLRAHRIKKYCDEDGAIQSDCLQKRLCRGDETPDENLCVTDITECPPGVAPGTTDCVVPSIIYDPRTDPPSAAVASLTCVQKAYDPENPSAAAECFDYRAPDLEAHFNDATLESPPDNFTLGEAEAGKSFSFPQGGWVLTNHGTTDAKAENRDLRHGFYLASTAVDSDDNPLYSALIGSVVAQDDSGETINVLAQGADLTFGASSLDIPDFPPGSYTLTLYVDDLEEVSEFNEVNNQRSFAITITEPNKPPVANDDTYQTEEDTPLTVDAPGVLANDTDPDGDALTASLVNGPANGDLTLNPDGSFTYTPNPNFNGIDSFTYTASDGELSDTALVTITVLPAQIWDFIGPMEPWYEGYPVSAGSTIPIKWYYEEDGARVDSYSPHLEIRVTGPFACGGTEVGAVEVVNDAGSSDLRYKKGVWQFNWDTVGLDVGCYSMRIFQPITGQIDGPFGFVLR